MSKEQFQASYSNRVSFHNTYKTHYLFKGDIYYHYDLRNNSSHDVDFSSAYTEERDLKSNEIESQKNRKELNPFAKEFYPQRIISRNADGGLNEEMATQNESYPHESMSNYNNHRGPRTRLPWVERTTAINTGPLEITLDEYRKKGNMTKPKQFNIRNPGEGDSTEKWNDTYILPVKESVEKKKCKKENVRFKQQNQKKKFLFPEIVFDADEEKRYEIERRANFSTKREGTIGYQNPNYADKSGKTERRSHSFMEPIFLKNFKEDEKDFSKLLRSSEKSRVNIKYSEEEFPPLGNGK